MNHVMTNPFYTICKQQRRRLACLSEKSDQPYLILSLDSTIPVDYILEKCGAGQLEYHLVANLLKQVSLSDSLENDIRDMLTTWEWYTRYMITTL